MSKEILETLEKRSNEIQASIAGNINNHHMLLGMAKEIKNLHSFLSKKLEEEKSECEESKDEQ